MYRVARYADPFDRLDSRFHNFEMGNDTTGDDLDAVATGVRFGPKVVDSMRDLIDEEETTGRHFCANQQIKDHIREDAREHHVCSTGAMKPEQVSAMVDREFKVYGIDNLCVLHASIFPRIPGFFIVTSVYMIAEMAVDVILARSA